MEGTNASPEDEFLTTREVAELARVNPVTVQRWVHTGRLAAVRLGPRLLRYRRSDVEALLATPTEASA